MKATLEFNLSDDHAEHIRAVYASDAWVALYGIDNRLRDIIKYGLNKDSSYEQELSEIRKEIGEITALIGDQ